MELDTRIQVRTNKQLKDRATKTLDRMGIDMPTAINMFLCPVVHDQRLPFRPSLTPYGDAVREAEAESAISAKDKDIDELTALIDRA
jgi:DNA-damage-inducible protein J